VTNFKIFTWIEFFLFFIPPAFLEGGAESSINALGVARIDS